jgi:hypothetical protein
VILNSYTLHYSNTTSSHIQSHSFSISLSSGFNFNFSLVVVVVADELFYSNAI